MPMYPRVMFIVRRKKMRELVKMIEEMERDFARIDWQDVAIFCITAVLVFGFVVGVIVGWF